MDYLHRHFELPTKNTDTHHSNPLSVFAKNFDTLVYHTSIYHQAIDLIPLIIDNTDSYDLTKTKEIDSEKFTLFKAFFDYLKEINNPCVTVQVRKANYNNHYTFDCLDSNKHILGTIDCKFLTWKQLAISYTGTLGPQKNNLRTIIQQTQEKLGIANKKNTLCVCNYSDNDGLSPSQRHRTDKHTHIPFP